MQTNSEQLTINQQSGRDKKGMEEQEQFSFSIEQFLNDEAFVDNNNEENANQSLDKQENQEILSMEENRSFGNEMVLQKKKKSIFHNFQKHLITLLKKYFRVGHKTVEGAEENQLAFQLWQAFIKTRSYNKKILHIIFGIQGTSQLQSELDSLAHEFKQFRTIKNKYSVSSIIRAQEMIRNDVILQSRSINRLLLQANCNVSRLQVFWEYFNSFIAELGSGPIAKRMTKQQKGCLIERICTKTKGV